MSKKVSIIIPCYNNAEYVGEAIESALNQTYKNTEIVIVNDGSTDNSSEVIKKYADKYKNIMFFDNEKNNGVVYARNMAIEACRGEYILPLDADDIIDETYVEKAVDVLNNNPDISIVYCYGSEMFGEPKRNYPEYNKLGIMYQNMIFVTAMYRKSDWEEVGGYSETMKEGYEDWDFWLSFVEKNKKPYRIPEVLFWVRNVRGSRNDIAKEGHHKMLLKKIINNHKELYLNNDDFVTNSFQYCYLKNKLRRKTKKMITIIFTLLSILFLSIFGNVYFAFGG